MTRLSKVLVSESESPQRFVLGLLARAAFLLAATASLNVLVDPFGNHETHLFEPIVLRSRRPKLHLYRQRRPPPDVVLLGSSRSFTMEPSYIEARASRSAFNAAVHGGELRDYVDLASCFAQSRTFPSVLIVSIGVEQMRGESIRPVEPDDPLASCRASVAPVATFVQAHVGALGIQETWASLRVLALEITGRPAPAYAFDADGTLRGGVHVPLEEAVDVSLAGNWAPTNFTEAALDPKSCERLRLLLEMGRAQGAKVIVFLPPYHPRALSRYLRESNFESLRHQLVARLGEWAQRYQLEVFDFTEVAAFGGRSDMFYDASHPREDAFRLMTDVMLRKLN